MSIRKFENIKALFHFDYPYYHEPGDGLRDEISGANDIFTRNEFVKFAGPLTAEMITDEAPLWGYRCPYFPENSAALSSEDPSLLYLIKTQNFEIEFFAKFKSLNDGVILNLVDRLRIILIGGAIKLSIDAAEKIILLDTWYHLRLRVFEDEISLFLNSQKIVSCPAIYLGNVSQILIGGFHGYIDELVFRTSPFYNDLRPDYPYQGRISINAIGGFGLGTLGDVTLSKSSQINSYGPISECTKNTFTVSSWNEGIYGPPKIGDEVLIHVSKKRGDDEDLLGLYDFKRILGISGNRYTLDGEISAFDFPTAKNNYYVQAVYIPEFKNLTVNQGVTISAPVFSTYGGLIAIRTSENFNLDGKIITYNTGPERDDFFQVTHAGLIDRFIFNKGGGIFITCGGKFQTSSDARLGATWDGSALNGVGAPRAAGTNGGAGYGGGGGGDNDSDTPGGDGGVGGGGGGQDSSPHYNYSKAGHAGANGTTGGYGFNQGAPVAQYPGGTQGVHPGGTHSNDRGGGGALGNGSGGVIASGACLILIAKTLYVHQSAISTGGKGGQNKSYSPEGGSGTGMCYIACAGVH